MIALISDIHGNLEALQAVLADIDSRGGTDVIYCLGDIVGYGPDPEACVDLVRQRCSMNLMGNHDHALLNGAVGFNPIAKGAIDCHRARMEPGESSLAEKQARWDFLTHLGQRHEDGEFLFVHASARDTINEYVMPTDVVYDPDKLADIFAHMKHICFVGHTHLPGVTTSDFKFYAPEEIDGKYTYTPDIHVIINLGSVGQPRDNDTRASYIEFDENGVQYYRVEYDYEKTIRKVKRTEGLDERCGTRLALGR